MRLFAFLLAFSLIGCVKDGRDGQPCSVVDNNNGTKTVTCPDGTSVIISDGVDGVDGTDTINEIIATASTLLTTYELSVVDIWCFVDNILKSRGTGIKTITGTIITANHVVDGCSNISLYNKASDTYLVGISTTWEQFGNLDIAEISFITWNNGDGMVGASPVFDRKPVLGEFLYTLHYPSDIRWDLQISTGRVVDDVIEYSLIGSQFKESWKNAFTSDYVATGGSSGAPVFDRNGNWFAIHVGGYRINLDLNYTLPLQKE